LGKRRRHVADRPNLVIIMTDQQRGDFMKKEGFALDTMPFVDSWGEGGMRFPRCYTPTPLCLPARCSLFTGRFPKALRVRENGGAVNIFFAKDLPQLLREQGYTINLVGKNHSHLKAEDFDTVSPYGHSGSGHRGRNTAAETAMDEWLRSLRGGVALEPTPFPLECQPPFRIVRDAVETLERRDRSKPFFLWLSFPEPHNPYQVPEPYYSLFPEDDVPERYAGPEVADKKGFKWRWEHRLFERKRPGYDGDWRRYRANYCGMLRLIDDQLRRFIDFLAAEGLSENTFIIFTSDHGDFVGDYGLRRKGVEVPECLVRVPFLIMGPGILAEQRMRREFISLVDLFPTLCEALALPTPDGVQGRSLWPLLTGDSFPEEEFASIYGEVGFGGVYYSEQDEPPLHFPMEGPAIDSLNCFTQSGNMKFVRKGRWKLVFDMMGRGQLYDLEEDPGELKNLFADKDLLEVRVDLLQELLSWTIRTEDDLPRASYIPKLAERNWYAPLKKV
jgi:arylsulfatase A-like enzyme